MAKIIANLIETNKTKEEGLNKFNVSEFLLSAKTNTKKRFTFSFRYFARKSFFEEVNSFPFILLNDIKRILHFSSFPFILFNDIKSHPQTQGIIKRREIQ